jgi:FixJ family two-component response regulator
LSKVPLVAIIDDNDSVGWAVAGIVGSEGFGVLVFPSAETFLHSLQMSDTACLIVNVQLPGMSGLQLQTHLAAAGRHIPIIFIAASQDEKARALARELGAVNVLDKASGDQALLKEIHLTLNPQDKEGRTSSHSPGQ